MRGRARGFTLLETVIALAILSVSLAVLMSAQASSLANAGRSRDLTVATLLARSKMIDVERHLFHDGFQLNTEDEQGDFADEGHPEVSWHYRISEVNLDLSALTSMCAGLAGKVSKKDGKQEDAAGDCEAMLGGLGATVGGFTEEIGRSLRLVDLLLRWPAGRYHETMSLRAMLSRDDFATAQESELQRQVNQATGSQTGLQGLQGSGPGAGAITAPPVAPAGH